MNKSIKVLVADDNEILREMIIDTLDDDDQIEVVGSAADGEAAIREIIDKAPDVVLIDLVMPKVDGLGVIESIRENEDYQGKKPYFIVVSAAGKEDIVSRALQSGADYFMMKPFEGEVLIRRIKHMVEGSQNAENMSFSMESSSVAPVSTENKIINLIRSLGVPVKMIGHKYLKEAIRIAIEDEESLISVTKNIYPTIADIYDTSPGNVERNIRYVIESTWNKSEESKYSDKLLEVFKGVGKKPTNSEFILLCSEWIKLGKA